MMKVKLEQSWKSALGAEFDKDYFKNLTDFVRGEYLTNVIYPAPANIFRALDLCPIDNVRVVIIGQDPYHEPGQAHGLCFSVESGTKLPPSLKNIYREIENDLGRKSITNGDLTNWANQGVLLLNSVLSVRAHNAASHSGKGWEHFTDSVISAIADKKDNIVYILWGSYAQKKADIILNTNIKRENLILKSVHPSPLSASRGFFGNHHFSRANEYLVSHGLNPIDW